MSVHPLSHTRQDTDESPWMIPSGSAPDPLAEQEEGSLEKVTDSPRDSGFTKTGPAWQHQARLENALGATFTRTGTITASDGHGKEVAASICRGNWAPRVLSLVVSILCFLSPNTQVRLKIESAWTWQTAKSTDSLKSRDSLEMIRCEHCQMAASALHCNLQR